MPTIATPLWGKCENETHTPKSGNLESSGTSKNLELDCRGQNTLHWGVLYIVGKVLKCRCQKWPRMSHSGHLQHKLWSKEGPRVKLTIWLPTTKNQESTRSRCVQVEWNTPLKSSGGKLQVCFRPHHNRRSELRVMSFQSPRSPNRDKKPLDVGAMGKHRE